MSYRGRRGQQRRQKSHSEEVSSEVTEDSPPIVKLFQTYQTELDTRYDKYERLVKKSRDLTIESKRIIFLLHRVSGFDDEDNEEILKEAENRLGNLFKDVICGILLELSKREVYQFIRAFSPGLQEFVEAVSFYYYLKNGNVVKIDEVHHPDFLHRKSSEVVVEEPCQEKDTVLPLSAILTPTDFVLGLADLTGELMRKCINSVAAGNIDEPFRLCAVLQNIYETFLTCSNYSRELKRKLAVLKTSLQKVENACYAIKIRGSEIPKHMLADFFSTEDEFNKEPVDCDI